MIAARYHRVAQGRQARQIIKEHRLDGGPGSGPRKGGGSAKKSKYNPDEGPYTSYNVAKSSQAMKGSPDLSKAKIEISADVGEYTSLNVAKTSQAMKSPAPASYGKISTKSLTSKQAEYRAKVKAAAPGSPEHAKASLKLGRIEGELAHRGGAKVASSAEAQAASPKTEHAVLAASAAAKQSEAQAAVASGDYKTAIAKTKEAAAYFKKATAEAQDFAKSTKSESDALFASAASKQAEASALFKKGDHDAAQKKLEAANNDYVRAQKYSDAAKKSLGLPVVQATPKNAMAAVAKQTEQDMFLKKAKAEAKAYKKQSYDSNSGLAKALSSSWSGDQPFGGAKTKKSKWSGEG